MAKMTMTDSQILDRKLFEVGEKALEFRNSLAETSVENLLNAIMQLQREIHFYQEGLKNGN